MRAWTRPESLAPHARGRFARKQGARFDDERRRRARESTRGCATTRRERGVGGARARRVECYIPTPSSTRFGPRSRRAGDTGSGSGVVTIDSFHLVFFYLKRRKNSRLVSSLAAGFLTRVATRACHITQSPRAGARAPREAARERPRSRRRARSRAPPERRRRRSSPRAAGPSAAWARPVLDRIRRVRPCRLGRVLLPCWAERVRSAWARRTSCSVAFPASPASPAFPALGTPASCPASCLSLIHI